MNNVRQGTAAELWQDLLRDAGKRSHVPLDESQESYLVFLLLRHQNDPQLLAHVQALDWLHAQTLVGQSRADALRDVGDRCLLIAGLFPTLAQRRRVSLDYFLTLGRSAYRDLADACRSAYAELFAQLAAHYDALAQVLRGLRETPLPVPAVALAPARRPPGMRVH
ncbi:hypothetical protein LJB71_01460 [Thermomonas sp. S9]|uniref:hypothetical protein n=1 Tax=Thermomonas sp. S9 TaxID=2885203 RepID=UPI00216AB93C|nr:hypothetical protein [Thermomonas sp. S9]MCR6495043.1 hypothetical protein [Thermomonas sp. S9]